MTVARCVITFPSVYHAFRAKKLLGELGVETELIPIPRELSGACEGLAARIAVVDMEKSVAHLTLHKISMVRPGVILP